MSGRVWCVCGNMADVFLLYIMFFFVLFSFTVTAKARAARMTCGACQAHNGRRAPAVTGIKSESKMHGIAVHLTS